MSLAEPIEKFIKDKIEVNIFTFNIPFEVLNNLAKFTNGIVVHITETQGDLEIYLKYLIYKNTIGMKNKTPFNIIYPQQLESSNGILCSCHVVFCIYYYQCAYCKSIYCKIPAYCSMCNILLMDSQFFKQNKRSYEENNRIGNYLNFEELSNILEQKNKEKIIIYNLNDLSHCFDNCIAIDKANCKIIFIDGMDNNNKKKKNKENRMIIDNSVEDGKEVEINNGYSIKHNNNHTINNILFLRKTKDKHSVINNSHHNNNIITENVIKERHFYNPHCDGCGTGLKNTIFDNPKGIYVCIDCYEILCYDCHNYLVKNKLGCLK